MTTIPERRREIDVIALFLVGVFGFAAWRGAEGAPIVAALFGAGAIFVLVAWIVWRRKPASFLAISPEEIFFGRVEQAGTVIRRASGSGRLEFRQGYKNAGWFLAPADAADGPAISMIGFRMPEVQAACIAHGWSFRAEPTESVRDAPLA